VLLVGKGEREEDGIFFIDDQPAFKKRKKKNFSSSIATKKAEVAEGGEMRPLRSKRGRERGREQDVDNSRRKKK